MYIERIEKLRTDMDNNGYELLILEGDVWRPGNIFYTTGFLPGAGGVSQAWTMLLIAKNKAPALLVGFEFVTGAREIVEDKFNVLPGTALDAVIKEYAVNGKVGIIGLNVMYSDIYRTILKYIDSANIVDATQLLTKYRKYKSPEEIEGIKKSHAITDSAITKAMSAIKEGVTEREVAAVGMAEVHKLGGLLGFFPTIAAGKHSAFAMQLPSDNVIEKNSNIMVDFGTNYRGYFSDCTRTAGFKLTDDYKRKIITTCTEAKTKVLKIIKPGLVNCEIEKCIRNYITEAGFGEYIVHDSGHGIGLDQEEDYKVNVNTDTVLEENMTFTIEPGIYVPGVGGCRMEEMVLVTEDGCEAFSKLADDWFFC